MAHIVWTVGAQDVERMSSEPDPLAEISAAQRERVVSVLAAAIQ